MPRRDAIERRVFRLAVLLTGREDRAVRVLEQVLDDRRNGSRDAVYLDRMTILRSREHLVAGDGDAIRGAPQRWAQALWSLPAQGREAWVLARVYKTPERAMARSMDCSTSATARHLDQADAAVEAVAGVGTDAFVEMVRDHSMNIDVPEHYRLKTRRRARRRRLIRRWATGLVVLLVLAAAAAAVIWWRRTSASA